MCIINNEYEMPTAESDTFKVESNYGVLIDPAIDYTKSTNGETHYEIDTLITGKWGIINMSTDNKVTYIFQHMDIDPNANDIENEIVDDLSSATNNLGFFPFEKDFWDNPSLDDFYFESDDKYQLHDTCVVISDGEDPMESFNYNVVISRINGKVFRIAVIGV